MSKKIIGIVVLLILMIVGVVSVKMFKTTISPQSIIITEATVSENLIRLKGDISASAIGYKGYLSEQVDGKLFIKIKGSSLNLTKPVGAFDILMENKFGKVNEVYLQGDSSSDSRLIWSSQK